MKRRSVRIGSKNGNTFNKSKMYDCSLYGACQRRLDRCSRNLVSFCFWCPFQVFPRKFRARKL